MSIAGLHAVNPYRGYEWREDALADEAIPLNFRTSSYPFRKPAADSQMDSRYMPSRKGLETLYVSGSAQPSLSGFGGLIQAIRKESKGPIYVVDLRQESHGFFNGTAVSWYGERDWSNINLSHQQVLLDEENRFAASLNQMRADAPLLAVISPAVVVPGADSAAAAAADSSSLGAKWAGFLLRRGFSLFVSSACDPAACVSVPTSSSVSSSVGSESGFSDGSGIPSN